MSDEMSLLISILLPLLFAVNFAGDDAHLEYGKDDRKEEE